uniref:Uncharacterized protein n=1 Tax=Lotus japonicus TaxID=34305 RepID=I3SZG1_LOTJA|nr:unknown [Lotus japonicus]
MANTKSKTKTTTTSTQYSKPKTSIFLCCFGSHMPKNIEESDPIIPERKRTSRFSWPRIRLKNNMMKSTSKTVPLEASFSEKAQPYPRQGQSQLSIISLHRLHHHLRWFSPSLPIIHLHRQGTERVTIL